MEVGQGVAVIEPGDLGHEAFDQTQEPVRAVDEQVEQFLGVDALLGLALVEPAFGARGILGGRHPAQGQKVAALEMRTFLGKLRRTLTFD